MPDKEKGEILDKLSELDAESKNFILGYMAGRTADKQDAPANVSEEEK